MTRVGKVALTKPQMPLKLRIVMASGAAMALVARSREIDSRKSRARIYIKHANWVFVEVTRASFLFLPHVGLGRAVHKNGYQLSWVRFPQTVLDK